MKISNYLGVSSKNLPFLDVDLAKDNFLFIDPRAIRIASLHNNFNSNKYAKKAVVLMDSFFNIITAAVLNQASTGVANLREQDLLNQFKEPNETRLGMSAKSPKGIGGGETVGTNIWTVLSNDLLALVRIGLLKRIEELSVFVPKVGIDITSDLTTRLIFKVLVEFTQDMMGNYKKLKSLGKISDPLRAWDVKSSDWVEERFYIPHYNGTPFLLVPREWVRRHSVISREKYFQNGCLTYAQCKESIMGNDGKLIVPKKKDLQERPEYKCNQENIINITLQANDEEKNLVDYVLEIMDRKYEVLPFEELSEYLEKR